MFSSTTGCLYIAACMAGITSTGTPEPMAVVAKVVTGVSSIPRAILDIVLAVAGATRSRSARGSRSPHRATCSTAPVSSEIGRIPAANSMA